MPSIEHNGLVEMFRENPELAAKWLSRLFAVPVPRHVAAHVVEAALDQLLPIEFRADLVIELTDALGNFVMAFVVEVQLGESKIKKYSWPVYWTVLRARKRCPVCVLVVAPDAAVASWAAEPIRLGPGTSDSVTPLVLGPGVLPVIKDVAAARREPELAVLSALAHGNGPDGAAVVEAAFHALDGFDKEQGAVYLHVIYNAVREPIKKALEALIMLQYNEMDLVLPPAAQKLIERGEAQGELKGRREGIREGRREGRVEAERSVLLKVVARAGIVLTPEQRSRIDRCDDPDTLDRWFDRALAAKTAEELFD